MKNEHERAKELLLHYAQRLPAFTTEERRMKLEAYRICGHQREKIKQPKLFKQSKNEH